MKKRLLAITLTLIALFSISATIVLGGPGTPPINPKHGTTSAPITFPFPLPPFDED